MAWWLAAAAVAAWAAAHAGALEDRAEAARAAWGEPVPVVVAVRALEPGDVLTAADVTIESWPPAVLPAGAFDAVPDGRTVTAPIVAGEAVVAARVAPGGLSTVAALLPPGWRAVAIPSAGSGFGDGAPPLTVGDRVDVLASFDRFDLADRPFDDPAEDTDAEPPGTDDPADADAGAGAGPAAGVVAAGALVLDVGDASVTVGVPAGVAPDVAFATTRGTVTLALVGAT
jgi:Flp pilus assembly protein CpaB